MPAITCPNFCCEKGLMYLWAIPLWAFPQKKRGLCSAWAVVKKNKKEKEKKTHKGNSAHNFFILLNKQRKNMNCSSPFCPPPPTCCTESFLWSCSCLIRAVLLATFSPCQLPGWMREFAPGFLVDWHFGSHSHWNAAQPRNLKSNAKSLNMNPGYPVLHHRPISARIGMQSLRIEEQ